MKIRVCLLFALLLIACQGSFAQDNGSADQQQRDFENKQRIYGTKHPWENTMPYGTQYTPPQSGAAPDTTPAPEVKQKPSKPAKKISKHKPVKTTKTGSKAQPQKAHTGSSQTK